MSLLCLFYVSFMSLLCLFYVSFMSLLCLFYVSFMSLCLFYVCISLFHCVLRAAGEPVECSYTNTKFKLVLDFSLLIEDYRGLTFTLLNRSSAKIGANPWNDVEGVSSAGVHWISAVRHLPQTHPLRKKFQLEFKESSILQAIGKMKPPIRRTTTSALLCAENFKNGQSDAEFVGVSQFHGTLEYPLTFCFVIAHVATVVALLLCMVCVLFLCLSLICLLFVSYLSLICLLFVSYLSLICLLFVSYLFLICFLIVS